MEFNIKEYAEKYVSRFSRPSLFAVKLNDCKISEYLCHKATLDLVERMLHLSLYETETNDVQHALDGNLDTTKVEVTKYDVDGRATSTDTYRGKIVKAETSLDWSVDNTVQSWNVVISLDE